VIGGGGGDFEGAEQPKSADRMACERQPCRKEREVVNLVSGDTEKKRVMGRAKVRTDRASGGGQRRNKTGDKKGRCVERSRKKKETLKKNCPMKGE